MKPGINRYYIDEHFNSEDEFKKWKEENIEKHEDGIRSLYNNEIIWALETEQKAYHNDFKLMYIVTWRNHDDG